jgi:hypothetical protein
MNYVDGPTQLGRAGGSDRARCLILHAVECVVVLWCKICYVFFRFSNYFGWRGQARSCSSQQTSSKPAPFTGTVRFFDVNSCPTSCCWSGLFDADGGTNRQQVCKRMARWKSSNRCGSREHAGHAAHFPLQIRLLQIQQQSTELGRLSSRRRGCSARRQSSTRTWRSRT